MIENGVNPEALAVSFFKRDFSMFLFYNLFQSAAPWVE